MRRWQIINKDTGDKVTKEDETLDAAIAQTGWEPKLCDCKEVTPKEPKKAPTKPPKSMVIQGPTDAENEALTHKNQIEAMVIDAELMFLKMGELLFNAREKGEWTILAYESFKAYVEDLKLPMTNSYSWATRLTNIYEYMVVNAKLDLKLLAEIGVAKLTRLLPLARKGELTEEVLNAALTLSDLDLRSALGQNVGGGGDEEDIVICPNCGTTFDSKKANRP